MQPSTLSPTAPKTNEPATPPPNTETNFKNCTTLREVYPDGVAQDHPAYQPKWTETKMDGHANNKYQVNKQFRIL